MKTNPFQEPGLTTLDGVWIEIDGPDKEKEKVLSDRR